MNNNANFNNTKRNFTQSRKRIESKKKENKTRRNQNRHSNAIFFGLETISNKLLKDTGRIYLMSWKNEIQQFNNNGKIKRILDMVEKYKTLNNEEKLDFKHVFPVDIELIINTLNTHINRIENFKKQIYKNLKKSELKIKINLVDSLTSSTLKKINICLEVLLKEKEFRERKKGRATSLSNTNYKKLLNNVTDKLAIADFEIDPSTGNATQLWSNVKTVRPSSPPYRPLSPLPNIPSLPNSPPPYVPGEGIIYSNNINDTNATMNNLDKLFKKSKL